MSNIGSTLLAKTQQSPHATPIGGKQRAFNAGTRNLLDEARNVVENATQQGQELNPMIYQMLGLEPIYEDHSSDLQSSQAEFDSAQQQWSQAQDALSQLQSIPKKTRSPEQRKQYHQLKKQVPQLQQALEKARDAHGAYSTMPKTITGFNRLEPENIPSNSPFSASNPLYQIQRTEAERAQQAMAGGQAVDPTLVHQYDQAESQLRAQLASRYGPDYENSSVGQIALQNFTRQKNEAYATWNFNAAQQYANQAYNQAGAQQSLLGNLIGLYREPANTAANFGNDLSNLAGQRLAQSGSDLQNREGAQGMVQTTSQSSPIGMLGSAIGGLGSLVTSPGAVDPATGQAGPSLLSRAGSAIGSGASWLGNEIAGGASAAANAIGSGASALYNLL